MVAKETHRELLSDGYPFYVAAVERLEEKNETLWKENKELHNKQIEVRCSSRMKRE